MSTMREEIYHKLHPFLEDLVDIACDNIEQLEKDDGWISVKDRLPDTDDEVLVTYWDKEDHSIRDVAITSYRKHIGRYDSKDRTWISPFDYFKYCCEIVAWKPKPNVYDGD